MNISEDTIEKDTQPEQPASFIQVIFKEYGSVVFQISVGSQVSPLQMIALGNYLVRLGEHEIDKAFAQQDMRQAEKAQRERIFVPGMSSDGIQL